MSEPSSTRPRTGKPRVERRAPRGAPGSVRWLKSLLGRPVTLERRGGKLHLTLLERRRPPDVIRAQERTALCEELRLRLLEHGERQVRVLRPLVAVHEALGKPEGWQAVARLSSALLAKAQVQLLMLQGREPSDALDAMGEHLRLLQAAAEAREEREQRDGVRDDDTLLVIEDLPPEAFDEAVNAALKEARNDEAVAWVDTESPGRP